MSLDDLVGQAASVEDIDLNSSIPFDDFGGSGSILHFAHANAYPPATYGQLLTGLTDQFTVLAVHHRPLWPGSQPVEMNDWSDLAVDMIDFLDQRGQSQVIGAGHSLGAIITIMAAHARPDLFRALILVEPVFLLPAVLNHFRQQPDSGQPYKTPLVEIAMRRRNKWASYQEAFEHFRPKPVFARWSDHTLWDYVKHGLIQASSAELELWFSPEWEARIYSRPPTGVWELISEITHPLLIMRGVETDTLVTKAWQLLQQVQSHASFVEVPESGHLVPMERPREIAREIASFVGNLDTAI